MQIERLSNPNGDIRHRLMLRVSLPNGRSRVFSRDTTPLRIGPEFSDAEERHAIKRTIEEGAEMLLRDIQHYFREAIARAERAPGVFDNTMGPVHINPLEAVPPMPSVPSDAVDALARTALQYGQAISITPAMLGEPDPRAHTTATEAAVNSTRRVVNIPRRHGFRRAMERPDAFMRLMMGTFDLDKDEEREAIEKKAMGLLRIRISRAQWKSLMENGYFDHKGEHGTYRFLQHDASGVRLIQKHKIGRKTRTLSWTLCIQSQAPNMPKGDVILARYLAVKNDEEGFLETANFRNVETQDEAVTSWMPGLLLGMNPFRESFRSLLPNITS